MIPLLGMKSVEYSDFLNLGPQTGLINSDGEVYDKHELLGHEDPCKFQRALNRESAHPFVTVQLGVSKVIREAERIIRKALAGHKVRILSINSSRWRWIQQTIISLTVIIGVLREIRIDKLFG